jgi:hypothetical protein
VISVKKTPLTGRTFATIIGIVIGAIVSVFALIQWELGRECVRWSTRIDMDDLGRVRRTRVCAEYQPRRLPEREGEPATGPR